MDANSQITDLRFDNLPDTTGFCPSHIPSLSWRLVSSVPGKRQTHYRIVAWNEDDRRLLWDSGMVESDLSAGIEWGGAPLNSRQRIKWQVCIRDERGAEIYSAPARLETPLFHAADWEARWISYEGNNSSAPAPCPYFRHEFTVPARPARARLYASARGVFELHLNGETVGRDHMAPGWTDFSRQVQYLTYDVTGKIVPGPNLLGAVLGDGWYCSYLSGRRRDLYGERAELLLQLELVFADGGRQVIATGNGWECTTGPILYSDLLDGEFYDARLELPDWDLPGPAKGKWKPAAVGDAVSDIPELVAKYCPPVRTVKEIPAVRLLHPRADLWIWDLGQNIAGNIRVRGMSGSVLYTFHYGEMLNPDGSLYNLNYRSARSTDYYIGSTGGKNTEWWEPKFTFHGFRYVQIDGHQFSQGVRPEDLEVVGLAWGSDLEVTGSFRCGNPKLNQLYSNIFWSQRDNFLEIPTDCPQRDERLGWTGDAEVFVGTAALNMNVGAFFRKYLRDMREAQRSDGGVANIAPDILRRTYDAAAWSDAAVICPWTIYMNYGDKRILAENYEMMCKWVEFQRRTSTDLIRPDTPYGDWLALSPVQTPSCFIGTAYFAYVSGLLGKISVILGKISEADYYRDLSDRVKTAFRRKFLGADGLPSIRNQTAFALVLHFDLLPPERRADAGKQLAAMIHANGKRLDTGFVGTACLNLALSESGHTDTACDLWLQEEYPSWLFSVNQGATTVWERWNSYTTEHGFGDVTMNSFNHYCYGAIHEWCVRFIGGIQYLEPGGKYIRFAPEPDERLKFAEFKLDTPYGPVSSSWHFESGAVICRVSSPPNTRMRIDLPDKWSCDTVLGELPCGSYQFTLRSSVREIP